MLGHLSTTHDNKWHLVFIAYSCTFGPLYVSNLSTLQGKNVYCSFNVSVKKKHMLISIFSTCFNVENYSGWDQVNDKISIRGLVNHQLDGFPFTWHSLWLLLLWKKRERTSEMNGNLRLYQKQWPSYWRGGRDSHPFLKTPLDPMSVSCRPLSLTKDNAFVVKARQQKDLESIMLFYETVVTKYRAMLVLFLHSSLGPITVW